MKSTSQPSSGGKRERGSASPVQTVCQAWGVMSNPLTGGFFHLPRTTGGSTGRKEEGRASADEKGGIKCPENWSCPQLSGKNIFSKGRSNGSRWPSG